MLVTSIPVILEHVIRVYLSLYDTPPKILTIEDGVKAKRRFDNVRAKDNSELALYAASVHAGRFLRMDDSEIIAHTYNL